VGHAVKRVEEIVSEWCAHFRRREGKDVSESDLGDLEEAWLSILRGAVESGELQRAGLGEEDYTVTHVKLRAWLEDQGGVLIIPDRTERPKDVGMWGVEEGLSQGDLALLTMGPKSPLHPALLSGGSKILPSYGRNLLRSRLHELASRRVEETLRDVGAEGMPEDPEGRTRTIIELLGGKLSVIDWRGRQVVDIVQLSEATSGLFQVQEPQPSGGGGGGGGGGRGRGGSSSSSSNSFGLSGLTGGTLSVVANPELVQQLVNLGISVEQARQALVETKNNVQEAANRLLG